MNKLKKNIFSLLVFQGGNYLIPMLTLPFLTRVLDVKGFGVYATIFSLSQYLVILIDYGFNLSATRSIASTENKKNINDIFWGVIHAKIILYCIAFLLLMIIWCLNIFDYHIFIILIMLLGVVFTPTWFFQGVENLSLFTKLMLFSKFIMLPCYFIFVRDDGDVWKAIGILSSVNFLSAILSMNIIRRKYLYIRYIPVSFSDSFRYLRDSSSIFWATLTISLYTSSTTLIISSVSNLEQVSIFAAGDRIRGAILGVFLVLGNAIYPRVNKLFSQSKCEAYKLIKKIFIIQTLLCLFIFLLFVFFSDDIAIIIYGESYSTVGYLFVIFTPAYFFILQSTVIGNYILLPLGYNKAYAVMPTICAIVHVPLCFILSYYYGALGGAWAITIIEFFSFIMLVIYMQRKALLKDVFK